MLEEGSKAGKAFKNIANRINGNDVPLLDLSSDSVGILGSIMKLFGRK